MPDDENLKILLTWRYLLVSFYDRMSVDEPSVSLFGIRDTGYGIRPLSDQKAKILFIAGNFCCEPYEIIHGKSLSAQVKLLRHPL